VVLYDANLTDAHLNTANLASADFGNADLTHALWPSDTAVPEGWQRDNVRGPLKRAGTNSDNPPAGPAPAV
jgi:hypothetical protein